MVTTAAIFLAFKVSDICPPLRHVLTVTYSIYNSMPPDEVAKLFMDQDVSILSLFRLRSLQRIYSDLPAAT